MGDARYTAAGVADVGRSRGVLLPGRATLAAFAVGVLVLFFRLGHLPLIDPDEGRNAQVAREMALTGDWLVPTYNGVPYLDKPALYFAAVAIGFRTLGISERVARLPSALCALLVLVLVYRFACREYETGLGRLAVVVLATTPLFMIFARLVIFDMPLALCTVAALLAGYRALVEEDAGWRRAALMSAAASGVGTLIKGPVGFLVPGLVLLVFGWIEARRRIVPRLLHPLNLIVFLAIVLPWFIGLSLARPEFPYYGLVRESLQRFSTAEFQRPGPFYYYVPVLMGLCFGWSMLYPESALLAIRRRARLARADRFLLTWILVVVVFFSLSRSKLPGYVLSVVPALALLTARILARALATPGGRCAQLVRRGTGLLAVLSLVVGGWAALEVFRPSILAGLELTQGRDYTRARAIFPGLLWISALIGVTAAAGFWRRSVTVALISFLILPAGFLALLGDGLAVSAHRASSKGLAREVETMAGGAPVVLLHTYANGLAFYSQSLPYLVTERGVETTSNYIPFYLEGRTEWPPGLIRPADLDAWLRARTETVLLLGRGREGAAVLDSLGVARGLETRALSRGYRALTLPPG